MKKFKQFLLIMLGLLLLCILSTINQDKSGPCCPFAIKHNGESNE